MIRLKYVLAWILIVYCIGVLGIFVAAFGVAFGAEVSRVDPLPLDGATIETAFAPGDEPSRLVATTIGEARFTVRMMTYQLSDGRIVNAVASAAGRGVDVRVIIDARTCETQRLQPIIAVLHRAGVEVACDGAHPIHHNKVVVIDGSTVVTGSFNFSPSARKSAENTAAIRNAPMLAAAYLAVWAEHRAHSEPRR